MKIPQLQHPQTLEVIDGQTRHEELMELVLKLNAKLRETEKELDSLIQLKQIDISTTSTNVIPTVSTTIPSTLASLAPTTPPTTTFPVAVESTKAGASGGKAAELVRAMEEMSI